MLYMVEIHKKTSGKLVARETFEGYENVLVFLRKFTGRTDIRIAVYGDKNWKA